MQAVCQHGDSQKVVPSSLILEERITGNKSNETLKETLTPSERLEYLEKDLECLKKEHATPNVDVSEWYSIKEPAVKCYVYFGDTRLSSWVRFIDLEPSEGTITLFFPSTSPRKVEALFWGSKETGNLAYILMGNIETIKYLQQYGLQSNVSFDKRLRSLDVIKSSDENVFLAVYAGIFNKLERYLIVGRDNNKSDWGEIKLQKESQLELIKAIISKIGYKSAILSGKIDYGGNSFEAKPVTFIPNIYSNNHP